MPIHGISPIRPRSAAWISRPVACRLTPPRETYAATTEAAKSSTAIRGARVYGAVVIRPASHDPVYQRKAPMANRFAGAPAAPSALITHPDGTISVSNKYPVSTPTMRVPRAGVSATLVADIREAAEQGCLLGRRDQVAGVV